MKNLKKKIKKFFSYYLECLELYEFSYSPETSKENLIYKNLNLRSAMWTSLKEWKELTAKWIEGKFLDIDTEEIRKEGEKH